MQRWLTFDHWYSKSRPSCWKRSSNRLPSHLRSDCCELCYYSDSYTRVLAPYYRQLGGCNEWSVGKFFRHNNWRTRYWLLAGRLWYSLPYSWDSRHQCQNHLNRPKIHWCLKYTSWFIYSHFLWHLCDRHHHSGSLEQPRRNTIYHHKWEFCDNYSYIHSTYWWMSPLNHLRVLWRCPAYMVDIWSDNSSICQFVVEF